MSEQENGFPGLPGPDHPEVGLQIPDELVKGLDEYPASVGFAVSRMVDSINGIPLRDEMTDEVSIPATVIRQPVNDEQASLDFSFRKPALVVNAGVSRPFECPFLMDNGAISFSERVPVRSSTRIRTFQFSRGVSPRMPEAFFIGFVNDEVCAVKGIIGSKTIASNIKHGGMCLTPSSSADSLHSWLNARIG